MFDQIDLEMALVERSTDERKRSLDFTGVKNFRDLGGYQTTDGKAVRWGLLYRSGHLHTISEVGLRLLSAIDLDRIIDFRAEHEKEDEPDRLPVDSKIHLVELPFLDSTTRLWHEASAQFMNGTLKNVDPVKYMVTTNIELATQFTPQMKSFLQELFKANGRPVLFHCAAGKDRTGFAAAVVLRILGVPSETVMDDYLLSNRYYLSSYTWSLLFLRLTKGKTFSSTVKGFLEVRPAYLSAAFEAIDRTYGSFEKYVREGLGLTGQDVEFLQSLYLE